MNKHEILARKKVSSAMIYAIYAVIMSAFGMYWFSVFVAIMMIAILCIETHNPLVPNG